MNRRTGWTGMRIYGREMSKPGGTNVGARSTSRRRMREEEGRSNKL